MPSFQIRYFDKQLGAVAQELTDAASEDALRQRLKQLGRVVLDLRPMDRSTAVRRRDQGKLQVAWWCRELSTLLKAGMTAVEALETLVAQSKGPDTETVNAGLLRSLREGMSLSRAMQKSGAFPTVLVASVTASERTSTLTTALEDYLRHDEMLGRLKRQIISAAIYPTLVVTLGLLISLFLLLYVIPRFSMMYADFRGTLSWATQTLLFVSRVLRHQLPLLLGVLAALGFLAVRAWQIGFVLKAVIRFVEGVRPLRAQWEHFRLAKLYQSLALMFRGGYTLDEALEVTQRIGLGASLEARVVDARSALARGRAVSSAFADAGLTDLVSARLLAVGERSGGFDAVLQTIADRHASAFSTFVERATRIVEPVLLLLVALLVGGIIVMMYMPIFDIAGGVR